MLCEIAENNQSELPEHVSPYTEHSCGKTVAIPKEMVSILQDGKMDLSKLLEKDPYASLEEEVC